MSLFQLVCETCDEPFKPFLATFPEEMLNPDYDECLEQAGERNVEALRLFHIEHWGKGHSLTTREI